MQATRMASSPRDKKGCCLVPFTSQKHGRLLVKRAIGIHAHPKSVRHYPPNPKPPVNHIRSAVVEINRILYNSRIKCQKSISLPDDIVLK